MLPPLLRWDPTHLVVDLDRVEVVIHRESVVHSMVEFRDGSILAHLGRTDMSLPIQYALTRPRRSEGRGERLDLAALGRISFAAPDRVTFPCLDLCYHAARQGGSALVALNAADEVAVAAFLHERIGFLDIDRINDSTVAKSPRSVPSTVDEVLAVDAWARRVASEEIVKLG